MSQSISRVLSRTIIHLGCLSPNTSCSLPKLSADHTIVDRPAEGGALLCSVYNSWCVCFWTMARRTPSSCALFVKNNHTTNWAPPSAGLPYDEFLFGLTPSGVYHAAHCYQLRGVLLPHLFTLTLTGRYIFCGTFRRLTPPRRYLALYPMGASGLSSR